MTTGDDESTFADVLNGLTFGGRRGRRPRSEHADAPPEPGTPAGGPPWSMPTPGAGHDPDPTWLSDRLGWMARNSPTAASGQSAPTTATRAGGVPGTNEPGPGDHTNPTGPAAPDRTAHGGPAVHGQLGRWMGVAGSSGDGPEDEDDHEPLTVAAIVRPYAWTRGRTRSSIELQVETLVSAIGVPGVGGPLEHRAIAELCQTPHSVAEVAAALGVPLGIAKVLVSDMAETGQLTVHRPAGDGAQAHYVLMERVLSGLRRL